MPARAPKRWTRRSADRPAELKQAALLLFADKGYAGTTIDDIARAADVTVGTVYRYFTDKAAIVAALVDDAIETPLANADSAGGLRSTLDQVWSSSRTTPHAQVLRILVAEGGHFPALVDRYRTQLLEPFAAELARQPALAAKSEPLLEARAVLAQVLGMSVLAGSPPHVPALLPQIAPREIGFVSAPTSPDRNDNRHQPADNGTDHNGQPPVQNGHRRHLGPEAW